MDRKFKAATLQDLADTLGLSKATVSRALNGSNLISAETRRRVEDAARAMNFTRNISAQRLSRGNSRTIAFVTHATTEPQPVSDFIGWEILGGIARGLQPLGYELLVKPVDYRDYSWVRRLLDSGQVDGFVITTSSRKSHHLKALIAEKAPFVAWGEASSPQFPSVSADNYSGGILAARCLAELGASPIAVVAGPAEEAEVKSRIGGFRSGLKEFGHDLDDSQIVFGDFSETAGRRLTAELLARNPRPRALFVTGDLMAIGAIKAAQELGVRVPDDLAVVGFDGLLIGSYADPSLTTVSQHIPEAGTALAQSLIRYLETGQISHVVLPVELVRRGSA